MGFAPLSIFVLFPVILVLWYLKLNVKGRYRGPGPLSLPIIGHLLSIPLKNQATIFHEWAKKYGDVFVLKVLGRSIVVLNSERAAVDLLEKKGPKYSDRPYLPTIELYGWDTHVVWMNYGKEFHASRKLFQDELSRKHCEGFQERLIRQARIMAQHISETPESYESHILRYVASVITEIAFGHDVAAADDTYLRFAQKFTEDLTESASSLGLKALEVFPPLKYLPEWFPGAWFVRHTKNLKMEWNAMEAHFFNRVKEEIEAGTAGPSFLANHLQSIPHTNNRGSNDEDLARLKSAAFVMYLAGNDTTWATLLTFILAMLLHPDIQRKVQEEIENVVGPSRIPDLSDREALPYVEAVMQETLRWHPAVPLGIPHRVTSDDEYRDISIPGGATVIANIRGITLDENVYHNPSDFIPERYLPNFQVSAEPHPKSVFGFGRRICPGRHLAETSIWIAMVTILSVFNIRPVKDATGRDVIPPVQFVTHLVSHPVPFKCEFKPKSEEAKALIVEDGS